MSTDQLLVMNHSLREPITIAFSPPSTQAADKRDPTLILLGIGFNI